MSAAFRLSAAPRSPLPRAAAPPCARAAAGRSRNASIAHSRSLACSSTLATAAAPLGEPVECVVPSRRAFVGGALVGVAGHFGVVHGARAAEAELAVAPGVVAVSGEGWTLSAPADFAQAELSPFLPPPGTTVGAGERPRAGLCVWSLTVTRHRSAASASGRWACAPAQPVEAEAGFAGRRRRCLAGSAPRGGRAPAVPAGERRG